MSKAKSILNHLLTIIFVIIVTCIIYFVIFYIANWVFNLKNDKMSPLVSSLFLLFLCISNGVLLRILQRDTYNHRAKYFISSFSIALLYIVWHLTFFSYFEVELYVKLFFLCWFGVYLGLELANFFITKNINISLNDKEI